jgi:hypothetical protein
MLSTGRTEDEDGYKSLLAGDFNGLKRNAKRKRTKATELFGACRWFTIHLALTGRPELS